MEPQTHLRAGQSGWIWDSRPTPGRVGTPLLSLFNEAEAEVETSTASEVDAESDAAVPPRKRRGKRVPADLERIEVRHELAAEERQCPHDGTALAVIGEETSEQLDIVPAKVRVLRHVQVKYACPSCREHVAIAAKPRSPIPGSQVSPGLLAHVAVSKYLDHWPLYRQGQVFERMGAVLHRSTMSHWMCKVGEFPGSCAKSSKRIYAADGWSMDSSG